MVYDLGLILASVEIGQWLCNTKQWDTKRTNCIETAECIDLNVIPDFNSLTAIVKGKKLILTVVIAS